MASAFSGILAYGFSQMSGLGLGSGLGQHHGPTKEDPTAPVYQDGGLSGWRWIFIMQGVITCLLGLAAYVLIVDFP